MPKGKHPEIAQVVSGSIAAEIGIRPGFSLLAVNGQPIVDIVDYRLAVANENLELSLQDDHGQLWEVEVEKDFGEDLGLIFTHPTIEPIKACRNNCRFCFVQQQPQGLRQTLVVRDDDYRLSALQGSFVTLTNLDEGEWQRILDQRLSPLYISVHTTNGKLREEMLRNPQAGRILDQLRTLAAHQIQMHCQIVLVPGLNDGHELVSTVNDLLSLWPAVQSVAVVPVGLTAHREGLPEVQPVCRDKAREVLDYLLPLTKRISRRLGSSFVYPADEFFVLANALVPERRFYDDFPQTENGVGLLRLLLDDTDKLTRRLPKKLRQPRKVLWVCGVSAQPTLDGLARRLNRVEGLWVDVLAVTNETFGASVTVTGLLGGKDIIKALRAYDLQQRCVLIPDVMLRESDQDFIDDTPWTALQEAYPEAEFILTPTDGRELVLRTIGEDVR